MFYCINLSKSCLCLDTRQLFLTHTFLQSAWVKSSWAYTTTFIHSHHLSYNLLWPKIAGHLPLYCPENQKICRQQTVFLLGNQQPLYDKESTDCGNLQIETHSLSIIHCHMTDITAVWLTGGSLCSFPRPRQLLYRNRPVGSEPSTTSYIPGCCTTTLSRTAICVHLANCVWLCEPCMCAAVYLFSLLHTALA